VRFTPVPTWSQVFRYIIAHMANDGFDELRRLQHREYSRRHAKTRRDAARDQRDRRIDVMLKGEMRDDYETVRGRKVSIASSPTAS
jgi:hypothetical protein